MRVSAKSDYALRALIELARGAPHLGGIPAHHLPYGVTMAKRAAPTSKVFRHRVR